MNQTQCHFHTSHRYTILTNRQTCTHPPDLPPYQHTHTHLAVCCVTNYSNCEITSRSSVDVFPPKEPNHIAGRHCALIMHSKAQIYPPRKLCTANTYTLTHTPTHIVHFTVFIKHTTNPLCNRMMSYSLFSICAPLFYGG